MHGVVATTAMDSMEAKETWPARRRRLDPNLKTSPPNNAQTFSTGASSSSSSSIEMTMAFVSVKTKSTTTMTTTPTTSIATTSANYIKATLTSAALAVVAHVGANRLS